MENSSERTAKTIRMRDSLYYQARVAAVTSRKSLGQWLEEAIVEKMDREPHVVSFETDGKDIPFR